MKEIKDIEGYVVNILCKCLNVPGLKFGANTVKPYQELQDITQQASYICYLLNSYRISKQNLKIYRDDKDTITEIKRKIKILEEDIEKKCKELEDFYNQRTRDGWN